MRPSEPVNHIQVANDKAKLKARKKAKKGFFHNIYNTQPWDLGPFAATTMGAQKAVVAGGAVNRALSITVVRSATEAERTRFQDGVGKWNNAHLNKKVESFAGMQGFLDILYFRILFNTTPAQKVFALRHFFNPYNYPLFLSYCAEGAVTDIARSMLSSHKNEQGEVIALEEPGVLHMTTHGIFAMAAGLQRFVVSSACRPLHYASKHPKLFTFLLTISAVTLNTLVYATDADLNSSPDHHLTLHEYYKNIASQIYDHVIIPMLGGMHGEDKQEYPHGLTEEDKDLAIKILTAYLVNHSAITLTSMGSQLGDKAQQTWRGIKEIYNYDGPSRFVAGAKSTYEYVTTAPARMAECVTTAPARMTECITHAPARIAAGLHAGLTSAWHWCVPPAPVQAHQIEVALGDLGIDLEAGVDSREVSHTI